jgi:Holliday junction DNA helicase RuvA
MIAWLKGEILRPFIGGYILKADSVGYKVFTPSDDLTVGQAVVFHIHHHIREDQNNLFGFITLEELNLFELLIQASGVGPKLALTILSKSNVSQVTQAISQGQPAILQAVPGVGNKVATKIVVELKSKLSSGDFDYAALAGRSDVVEAVMSLGMSQGEVLEALKDVPADLASDEQIKLILKQIGKNKKR